MYQKHSKIAQYTGRFAKVKTELLALKWDIDTHEDANSRVIRYKFGKIGKILFEIEREFAKIKP
jgi:hypothetical protein